jgi:tRNA-specific 2-thiouridylase
MPRVVLAMSGGVDSSVSAFLLREQGYEVIGLFMRTGVPSEDGATATHKKGCCSAVDAGDGRRIADRLGIPFYSLDFEREFSRIIDYFTDEYLAGRTPNPCVVCNNWLKFGKLWSFGRQLGADFIATGHYARVVSGPQGPELHRAVDPNKDQSYVLHGIKRSLLPHLLFPVGTLPKSEVRAIARRLGLPVAEKPDSVEICFVPDQDHARLIRERRPDRQTAGHFVDRFGRILAPHDGYERFTIGQRKGLGYAGGARRYVLDIIPETREVVLGDRDDLLSTRLVAERVNWLIDVPETSIRCQVKIRYRHEPAPAVLFVRSADRTEVEFEQPQSAITPGQAAVFYDGSRVLGGGWIAANR